jgi:hypothetical protein
MAQDIVINGGVVNHVVYGNGAQMAMLLQQKPLLIIV